MTPFDKKKRHERFYAEEAGKLLDKTWALEANEHPDFIVTEDGQKFGLEICQIFKGMRGRKGSQLRKNEAEKQRAIDALRREYEEKEDIRLVAKFLGNTCDENMAKVVPKLLDMNLSNKPLGYQENFTVDDGPWGPTLLKIYVTRAFRSWWYSVDDCVGWVDRNPMDFIDEAVKKKSPKLMSYKDCTDLDDIRLLIVADRMKNSGKLELSQKFDLNTRGFRFVYFFSYPESVIAWDSMIYVSAAVS